MPTPSEPTPSNPAPPIVPRPSGQIVWSSGHETGNLSEWNAGRGGGEFNSGDADAVASTDVAHDGRYSAKLTTRTPPEAGTRLFRWNESERYTEAYYSAWFYLPVPFRSDWSDIFQFKSQLGAVNDPFWFLQVKNRPSGAMYLVLSWWNRLSVDGPRPGQRGGREYHQSIADLPAGRWTHIEVFLRQSADFDGRIVVWQDGVELFNQQDVRTKYRDSQQSWAVTNYGSGFAPTPVTIYVDDAMIRLPVSGPQGSPSGIPLRGASLSGAASSSTPGIP
jgi:hypothetical protein